MATRSKNQNGTTQTKQRKPRRPPVEASSTAIDIEDFELPARTMGGKESKHLTEVKAANEDGKVRLINEALTPDQAEQYAQTLRSAANTIGMSVTFRLDTRDKLSNGQDNPAKGKYVWKVVEWQRRESNGKAK